MLATSSPLIPHSVNVSCWSALRVSSVYHIVISCPLLSLWSPFTSEIHRPQSFCCYDPFFVIFSWISVCLFKLEEFVDIVFLSSSWSYCYSVGLVSWTEFHSAIFTMYLSLGRDAILSASLHFILLWVLNQHRVFAFLSLKGLHLCVHSSSSIAVMSISSSTSFLIERSLSLS